MDSRGEKEEPPQRTYCRRSTKKEEMEGGKRGPVIASPIAKDEKEDRVMESESAE